jgi:unsaturated pyranuronate lyase
MTLHRWAAIEAERMNPLLTRQVIHGEHITVARIQLAKGAIVPVHSHINEQITLLEKGRLRFVISGEERILQAGEALQIPPNAPHEVEALEDSLAVDLFSPIRADWISGDDAYLRR